MIDISQGKIFADGIGPAEQSTDIAPTETVSPTFFASMEIPPVKEIPKETKRYPEYLEEENAKALFEKEVANEEVLSPLAFTYYLNQANTSNSDEQNTDLFKAVDEQKKMFELYKSGQKLSKDEWEVTFQNASGWKEIREAMGDEAFWDRTRKYLTICGITAELNKEYKLSRVLQKTAEFIRPNLSKNTYGA